MKVLISNKQEQVLEHLGKILEASFENDFARRTDEIADEVMELAIIVGDKASLLRLIGKVSAKMKMKRSRR